MTDTGPPGNPGDVIITGQRRSHPGQPFPERPEPLTGPVNPDTPSIEDDPGLVDPCADPRTALDWNIDAAAAEAKNEFERRAAARIPPEDLNKREWGAFLYRRADGSIRIGPINFGPEFQAGGVGSVALIRDGADADIVGFVHSHRNGSHLPSDGTNLDNPGDLQVLDSIVASSGNPDVRMYIVAQNQGPVGFTPYYQINFYNTSNALSSRQRSTPGPEVNPEAVACSGS